MADSFHRTPGDQAAYGYRQLPGTGPAGGPELKTMVFGTIGVALGIVVGTLIADGSLRSMSPFASHQPVRAGTSASAVAGRPGSKTVQSAPQVHQAAVQSGSQLTVAQRPAAPATSTVASTSIPPKPSAAAPFSSPVTTAIAAKTSAPTPATPVAKTSTLSQSTVVAKAPIAPKTTMVAKASIPSISSVLSTPSKPTSSAKTATALTVSAAHKRRAAHRQATLLRWAAWRKLHPKHRVHGHLKAAALPIRLPELISKPRLVEAPVSFTFMIEGSASVANYDPVNGVVDTYEGETFTLDKGASEGKTIAWLDYPAQLHYRCDQFWNCTLFHDGMAVPNAKRTK
jgi:hypothetical protein